MKKFRKVLALVLALMMTACVLGVSASAASLTDSLKKTTSDVADITGNLADTSKDLTTLATAGIDRITSVGRSAVGAGNTAVDLATAPARHMTQANHAVSGAVNSAKDVLRSLGR